MVLFPTRELRKNQRFRRTAFALFTFSEADVEQLAAVRNTDDEGSVNTIKLLTNNNILTYADMKDTTVFLSSEPFASSSLFSFPSFSNMLDLTVLASTQTTDNAKLNAQAYAFGIANASTITQFIDLANFFVAASKVLKIEKLSAQLQKVQVQSIYNQLLPDINYLLFSPDAGTSKSEKYLRTQLPELAKNSEFIGYSTSTSAALNLVQVVDFNGVNEVSQQDQITKYLQVVKKVVSTAQPSQYKLSQDGNLASFRYENEEVIAFIGIDETGTVFIMPDTKLK